MSIMSTTALRAWCGDSAVGRLASVEAAAAVARRVPEEFMAIRFWVEVEETEFEKEVDWGCSP